LRKRLLAAAWAACLPAFAATSFSTDVTDLWWNPDESGWGVNVMQQDNVVFATFFVYGADGKAHWYVASSMAGQQASASEISFSGSLYETNGPSFGAGFNPAAVTRREVGTATLRFTLPNEGSVTYTVNGASVTKQIRRQTWAVNDVAGQYTGSRGTRVVGGPGCTGTTGLAFSSFQLIEIAQSNTNFTMRGILGNDGCSFQGTYSQEGHLGASTGTYTCNSGSLQGTYTLSEMEATRHGFLARYSGTDRGCQVEGRIGGVRTTVTNTFSANLTDLWWNPRESGWGLNIVQQSNVLFATLFAYDSTGQPHWFVAPNLVGEKIRDGQRIYATGKLYETTGPAFSGAAFNPAAVVRREVGPVTLEYPVAGEFAGEGMKGLFVYTVDGVGVSKRLDRQTWAMNHLSGTYSGGLATQPYLSPPPACAAKTGVQIFQSITVSHSGTSFSMTAVQGAAPPTEFCRYTGTYGQEGHLGSVGGVFSCDGGASGSFWLQDVEIGTNGISAKYEALERGCNVIGNFAAVRSN
jgi:hypothetical protein